MKKAFLSYLKDRRDGYVEAYDEMRDKYNERGIVSSKYFCYPSIEEFNFDCLSNTTMFELSVLWSELNVLIEKLERMEE